jgi:hypothetical protein
MTTRASTSARRPGHIDPALRLGALLRPLGLLVTAVDRRIRDPLGNPDLRLLFESASMSDASFKTQSLASSSRRRDSCAARRDAIFSTTA